MKLMVGLTVTFLFMEYFLPILPVLVDGMVDQLVILIESFMTG